MVIISGNLYSAVQVIQGFAQLQLDNCCDGNASIKIIAPSLSPESLEGIEASDLQNRTRFQEADLLGRNPEKVKVFDKAFGQITLYHYVHQPLIMQTQCMVIELVALTEFSIDQPCKECAYCKWQEELTNMHIVQQQEVAEVAHHQHRKTTELANQFLAIIQEKRDFENPCSLATCLGSVSYARPIPSGKMTSTDNAHSSIALLRLCTPRMCKLSGAIQHIARHSAWC